MTSTDPKKPLWQAEHVRGLVERDGAPWNNSMIDMYTTHYSTYCTAAHKQAAAAGTPSTQYAAARYDSYNGSHVSRGRDGTRCWMRSSTWVRRWSKGKAAVEEREDEQEDEQEVAKGVSVTVDVER